MRDIKPIQTEELNDWDLELALSKFQNEKEGIIIVRVKDIFEWIYELEKDARLILSSNSIQRAKVQGEVMMLRKLKYALTSSMSREQVDRMFGGGGNNNAGED